MGLLRVYLKAVFRYRWAGVGCAVFGVGGFGLLVVGWSVWAAVGLFAVAVGLAQAGCFLVWREQRRAATQLFAEKTAIEHRHNDTLPVLGLSVAAPTTREAWKEAVYGIDHEAVFFSLHHLGGRVPTGIQFDPTTSLGGSYSLRLTGRQFVLPSLPSPLSFEVWKEEVRPGHHSVATAGLTALMMDFVWDSPSEMVEFCYEITVRFEDRGESRSQVFPLVFDTELYRFIKP